MTSVNFQAMARHLDDEAKRRGRRAASVSHAHLFDREDGYPSWACLQIEHSNVSGGSVTIMTDDPEILRATARGMMALAARLEAKQKLDAQAGLVPSQAEAEAQLAPF